MSEESLPKFGTYDITNFQIRILNEVESNNCLDIIELGNCS